MAKAKIVCECPKCGEEKPMTRHHVYPKRFFGTRYSNSLYLLCRECHNELEKYIPQQELMPKAFYLAIIEVFLKGGCDET